MNFKAIFRNVGFALLMSAFFMFLSVLVSIASGNDSALAALSISFILTFVVGIFPIIFVRKAPVITLIDGYMIIVLSWLLSFIFGMMPYLLWGGPFTFINALFESVSGFTTTGATILDNVQGLPDSLLFWRSATHFIGGMGIVVFLILIVPSSSPMKLRLMNLELSALSKENYRVAANKTFTVYVSTYLALNALAFISYWIAGMSAFDAINHAFSVVATGGFSTKNLSISAFNSLPITLLTILFMYLSSIHFGLLYFSFVTKSFKPLNNPIIKLFTLMLILGSISLAIVLKIDNIDKSIGSALLDGAFQVVSYMSTTGFAISDNSAWPVFPCIFMIVFTIVGGCAGSTAGGIRVDRTYLLFQSIRRHIHRALHPSYVEEVKVGTHIFKSEELTPHIIFIALYLFVMLVSMLLNLIFGVDLVNSIVATISTMGNVGPGCGDMGNFGSYNGISAMAKLVYICDMFLGRLEIYPILALISLMFVGQKK